MKALQKVSKFLSDYTSIVVIAIAVVTFFLPSMLGWVNLALFTDCLLYTSNVNSFDQEGVQLGKVLAKRVLAHETDGALKVFSDLLNI